MPVISKKWKQGILFLFKWLILILLLGLGSGLLSAVFLKSLTWVTKLRLANPWLIFFLPLAGALFAYFYQRFGGESSKGNNLIIEAANGGRERVPLVMIPLTLFGTLTAHLFGGSVGREGTAVQMGGSLADFFSSKFQLSPKEREMIIICGISGGFSSIFGTPFAGAIFGIEVLVLKKLRIEAIIPSLLTALVANFVGITIGTTHSRYLIGAIPHWSMILLFKLILIGILFGLTSRLFSRSIFWIKKIYSQLMPNPVIRNLVGGIVVLLLVALFQTTRYLGISLNLLSDAFNGVNQLLDFLLKLIFTSVTLGAGFQGGEVTPLFEIGATLGSSLAQILALPVAFIAALGFIGVFAGATNTPITCLIMGIELFGFQGSLYMALICFFSYQVSGNRGIYSAQITNGGKYSIIKYGLSKIIRFQKN